MNTGKLGKLKGSTHRTWEGRKTFNSKSNASLKSWFEIWHVVNFSFQNLTRCIFMNWKNDAMYFSDLKSEVLFFSIENLTRLRNFNSKLWLLKSTNSAKCVFFDGVNWTKTLIFDWKHFFESRHDKKNLGQSLTHCSFLTPKSNALWNFQIKIIRVGKFSIQNLTHYKVLFQNLTTCTTFPPESDSYLVFQVLTERWYRLSLLVPTYFKGHKRNTKSDIDLIATRTTENSHMSIRLSFCEGLHSDNTYFSLWTEFCGA